MSAPSEIIAGTAATPPEKLAIPEALPVPDAPAEDSPAEPEEQEWGTFNFLLIGLVVFLALAATVTAAHQIHHGRNRSRVIKDLTNAAAAVRSYVRLNGTLPNDTAAGVVPAGMASLLAEINWTAPTPIGGLYRLVNLGPKDARGVPAPGTLMIAITAFPPASPLILSTDDLTAIDRAIDDGNLATGDFRAGFAGWPVLWVRLP
ncbi:hypothetical protein [Horticoccus sp. 23ND18S-11]|uniref:hypothetical protein n=1 Tax=Horticoccus sp. 23ND18S-11 TaxID=3391832 RepID=UPI0039C99F7B